MDAIASFKLAKLIVLTGGMFLESYRVPMFQDVRRHVQLNIIMASVFALAYYSDDLMQWVNAWNGMFLAWVLGLILPEPVIRSKNVQWYDTKTDVKRSCSCQSDGGASLIAITLWLIFYVTWNLIFATQLSGWVVAWAHNMVPLLLIGMTGYSSLRKNPSTAFYFWAFFRAICISMVELLYLGPLLQHSKE
jgi:phosphatidylserine synthase